MRHLDIQIRLLGTLEIDIGGSPVPAPTGKPRALLALLAMSAAQPVPVDTLATGIWDDRLPANVRASLQTYVLRLRRSLPYDLVETSPSAYCLRLEPEAVDLVRFRQLVAAAATAEPAAERDLLAQALELWRGEPLSDIESDYLARDVVPGLIEERLTALERRVDLDLALGREAGVIAELTDATAAYPLRESLWARLITALRRAGRPAEAIEAYHRLRAILTDQLGIDPSADLRRLYQDTLAGDTEVAIVRSNLAQNHYHLGHFVTARRLWEQALPRLAQIRRRLADDVAAKLESCA